MTAHIAADIDILEGTFAVLDDGNIPVDSADWSTGLAAPMTTGAIIMTGINMGTVRVTAAPLPGPPPQDEDRSGWEEIVEISVRATGRLQVESLEEGPAGLPVLNPSGAGWYRLRVHARGREAHYDDVVIDSGEEYLLLAWPTARSPDPTVIRTSTRITHSLEAHHGQPAPGPESIPPPSPPTAKPGQLNTRARPAGSAPTARTKICGSTSRPLTRAGRCVRLRSGGRAHGR
ncbi:hypothetical protein ACIP88_16805 [Streptomyces uncialis]|uniref:hypothetical protein n=1 Tax=Streptomyces uncialis TaxID=1048205 RepID=UPI00381B13DD